MFMILYLYVSLFIQMSYQTSKSNSKASFGKYTENEVSVQFRYRITTNGFIRLLRYSIAWDLDIKPLNKGQGLATFEFGRVTLKEMKM